MDRWSAGEQGRECDRGQGVPDLVWRVAELWPAIVPIGLVIDRFSGSLPLGGRGRSGCRWLVEVVVADGHGCLVCVWVGDGCLPTREAGQGRLFGELSNDDLPPASPTSPSPFLNMQPTTRRLGAELLTMAQKADFPIVPKPGVVSPRPNSSSSLPPSLPASRPSSRLHRLAPSLAPLHACSSHD